MLLAPRFGTGNVKGIIAGVPLILVTLLGTATPAASDLETPSSSDLFAQGISLHGLGEFDRSLAVFERALAAARNEAGGADPGKCLLRMGILKWDLGDIDGSAVFFSEAAVSFEKDQDLRSAEFCSKCLDLTRLYRRGRDERQSGLLLHSADLWKEALALARDLGIPDLQLKCLRQEALAYLELGELELFKTDSRSGLDLAMKLNHRLEQGRGLNNLGVYYQQRIDYSRALTHLEQALAVLRSVGDSLAEAQCLNNLGLVYRELGDFGQAHQVLQEALDLDRARNDPTAVSMDLDNIGSVLLRKGLDEESRPDLVHASEAFQESLQLQDPRSGDPLIPFAAHNNMGIIRNEMGDHQAARDEYALALKIAERGEYPLERSHVLANIAASYFDEEQTDQALAYYRASYQLSRDHSFENVLLESCLGLGQCHERQGDAESALSSYMEAIRTLEGIKARLPEPLLIGFSRKKYLAYERAVAILADRHERSLSAASCRTIFDLVERARARAFLESLGDYRPNLGLSDLRRIQERQQVISRNIAALASRITRDSIPGPAREALERELEREEEESVRLTSEARHPEDSRIQAWGRSVRPLDDIQRLLLDGNEVLLEYFLGDPCSFLLRISPADARLYRLPAEKALERSLKAYLKSLSDRSQDPRLGLAAAERIGRELLPPASDESFGSAKKLIIIPDGILHDLPYEALRVPAGRDAHYLIEDREVSYAPSASALAILKGRNRPNPWKKRVLTISGSTDERKLSVADPVILPPLSFIRKEVSSITRFYPPSSVDTLGEGAATESRVKAWPLRDYRVIHFACHGLLNGMNPLRSALVLSSGVNADEDGLLQMREIYGLDLSAEIIVLSACQTGVGRIEESEGPLTLARPFFFAGARAVVASLWPISDRSTVPFMEEFYKRLSQGRPASESLREAKLRMLLSSRWSHPFYWAGFLLQGDPSASGGSNFLVSASRAGR